MFALFSVFSLALVLAVNAQDTCGKYGGTCTDSSLCGESSIIKGGLCADISQKCCLTNKYEGSECQRLGGECIDDCPAWLLPRPFDCPRGTRCCIR